MKFPPYRSTSLAAGAFLLAGSFALAQSTSAARNMHPRDAASGQSSGRQAQSGQSVGMAVDHQGGNGVRRADPGKSGDNPLYEGKGQANLKPGAGSSAVQYKDPEDMTTRYRPGNNKTTASSIAVDHAGGNGVRRMDGGQSAGTSSNLSPSAVTQNRKHLAGVKYQDRTSGGGNSARGIAVNEQGSSSAPVRRRR